MNKQSNLPFGIKKAIQAVFCLVFVSSNMAYADLKHRYTFSETGASTTVADSVGGADGVLVNNTGAAGFSSGQITLGNDGSQASNGGTGDYVDFPNGILTDLVGEDNTAPFSIEIWFTWDGAGDWQRIWDFGTSTGGEDSSASGDGTAQFFATPQAGGGGVRVAYRGQGLAESSLTVQPSAPAGQEHHLVFVWDEPNASASFYLNGALAGRDSQTDITIADNVAGNDVNNWLGRSQWNDTLFVGSYNEFRIYDHALQSFDVAKNFVGGADSVEGGDLGELLSIEPLIGSQTLLLEETITFGLSGDFERINGVDLSTVAEFASSNTSVATVSANGLITAVGIGTAQISATYEGQNIEITVEVVIPPLPEAVLRHRYNFNDSVGSNVIEDSVGNADGEAINIDLTGSGSAILNGGNQGYINLPNGIISSMENATLEAWTTFDGGGGAWQRLFDFGNTTLGEDPDPNGAAYSGSASWFFAPRQGAISAANGGRYAFDPGPGGENPQINPPASSGAPVGEEFHTVAVYNHAQRIASIWINGNKIGEAPVLPDRPLTALDDVNNWLGRSQWSGDAFATGNFNEFRIYEGVLDPLQIAVNSASGPDNIIADPGEIQSLSVEADTSGLTAGGLPAPLRLTADFAAVNDVNVTALPAVSLASSNESVAMILNDPPRVVPVGPGSAVITGSLDGEEATALNITVAAAASEPVLKNRYTFDADINDSVGDLHGELIGEGVFENGGITISGEGYIDLPDFLFSDFYFTGDVVPVTLEIFGTWNGGPVWQRMIDFGSNSLDVQGPEVGDLAYNGVSFLFITPNSGSGELMFEYNDSTGPDPQMFGTALVPGEPFHVAVVFDPVMGVSRLYRNGVLQAIAPISPDTILAINDPNTWLGRSNFSADAFYNGTYTEFRVWEGALLDAQIRLHSQCGPDAFDCDPVADPAVMNITFDNTGVSLEWTGSGVLESASNVTGPWTVVDGATSPYSSPASGDAQYFRVVE